MSEKNEETATAAGDGKNMGASLFKAANILMVTMLISRLLGYVRDIIIFAQFGQNYMTDAYNAAFSIPDFLYMILVGGALSSAFIPMFSSYIAQNKEKEGWLTLSIMFNWIMVLLVAGVAIGIALTPQLINLLVPDFAEETKIMTITLTRIMFIQVIFMCLSGISTGILQSYKNFTAPAIGSVLYNLGTILGGLLLAAPIEALFPGYGIAAFSVGVVIGAFLNFFVQFVALLKIGIKYTFSWDLKNEGVRQLLVLIVPVFIGLAASEFNLLVNQNLASGLEEGLLSALRCAQRLMQLPISIFGITVGVAFFPTMTQLAAQDNIDGFKKTLMMGIRTVMFVCIPASVGLAVLATPVIRFMYEFDSGAFTAEDTAQTAYALVYYCIGVFAYAAIHTLSRAFYSLKNTKTPVYVAVLSIVANVALSIFLVDYMQQAGLALAYSLAGIFNMVVLVVLLSRLVGDIGAWDLLKSSILTTIISLVMGGVVWYTNSFLEGIVPMEVKMFQLVPLVISIVVGILVFAFLSVKLKMPEAQQVWGIIERRLKRKRKAV